MGGALLLIAVVVIPLVAGLRLLFIFLNQYCLAWAAAHVVADLRVDLLRQIQRQHRFLMHDWRQSCRRREGCYDRRRGRGMAYLRKRNRRLLAFV